MIKINNKDLYWLAGLLEGEGCFSVIQKKYAMIRLSMTDKDVVERAANVMNISKIESINPKRWKGISLKTQYKCTLTGISAFELMNLLKPYMGKRKQKQINLIIKLYEPIVKRKLQMMNKVLKIRKLFSTGEYTQNQLSIKFNLPPDQISRIVNRKRWKI